MTRYYLEVIKDCVSILIDSDTCYYHKFKIGDIIVINMYSNSGPKVLLWDREYCAEFTIDWDKTFSSKFSVSGAITKDYLKDITIQIERQKKLDLLL